MAKGCMWGIIINGGINDGLYYFYLLAGMSKQSTESVAVAQIGYRSARWGSFPAESQKTWRGEETTEDIFFKSQISLAETCQDQPRSHSLSGSLVDDDSLSVDSKAHEDYDPEITICHDYFLRGFCMHGEKCPHPHLPLIQGRASQRRRRVRQWVLREMPQILLGKWKRVRSFLN